MNTWFRFYHEALDDPKVQKLPAELFRDWVNLLCLACRNDGILPQISDVSFAFRKSETDTLKTIDDLCAAGLLDRFKSGRLHPHGWDSRQFKSDCSTERVKRFRNVSRNTVKRLNETDQTQTIPEHIQNIGERVQPPAEKRGGRTPDPAYEVFAEAHQKYKHTAYVSKEADFVHLAKLRKANSGTWAREPVEVWETAVKNYFESALGTYTLADLCVRFATFLNDQLDGYGKPVNHPNRNGGSNGQPKSKTDRNREAAESLLRDLENSGSGQLRIE